jgi:DNA polymerase III epsilon subunit-like protein
MIVVDIETSGIDPYKCGIWQIGAIEIENPSNQFFGESKIDESDLIEDEALVVTGKTKKDLRNPLKKSQEELMIEFFSWLEKIEIKNLLCQNPQFDIVFIRAKADKYNLKVPFRHRVFDLHSIAQLKYYQLNNKFLINSGHSDMGLTAALEFCGIEDPRIMIDGSKILREGTPHSAIEDCKLEAECFYRIVYGKGVFEDYKRFLIPKYLTQNDNI